MCSTDHPAANRARWTGFRPVLSCSLQRVPLRSTTRIGQRGTRESRRPMRVHKASSLNVVLTRTRDPKRAGAPVDEGLIVLK
jgi:hypothetical protein